MNMLKQARNLSADQRKWMERVFGDTWMMQSERKIIFDLCRICNNSHNADEILTAMGWPRGNRERDHRDKIYDKPYPIIRRTKECGYS